MVNSGTVQSNRDHFVQCLDAYQSEIQGLTGSWEGLSYDQFISRAEEVVSEYSAISSQLSDFAQACDKYEEYMVNKTNKENALQSADVNRDNASIARNSAELNATADTQEHDAEYYQNNMNRLKAEINSLLSSASSKSFTADPIANHAPNFNIIGVGLNENLKVSLESGYVFPLEKGVNARVTSKMGWRDIPTPGATAEHKGTDIGIPTGTKLYAMSSGTIKNAGRGTAGGYGNWVQIQQDDGRLVTYGHVSRSDFFNVGDRVNAGDLVALSGNEGVSTGPHLHLQIEEGGKPLDSQVLLADVWS